MRRISLNIYIFIVLKKGIYLQYSKELEYIIARIINTIDQTAFTAVS